MCPPVSVVSLALTIRHPLSLQAMFKSRKKNDCSLAQVEKQNTDTWKIVNFPPCSRRNTYISPATVTLSSTAQYDSLITHNHVCFVM